MFKQGLILGIDYTDDYCQATFYNIRHSKPESVTSSSDIMRYLIPTALVYDTEKEKWLVGNEALERSQLTGADVFSDFLRYSLAEEKVIYNADSELEYRELFGIYLGMLIEMAKTLTGNHSICSITLNVNEVTLEKKDLFMDVFEMIGYDEDQIKILARSESFAYFLLNENRKLWEHGSLLLDFSNDGFFTRLLTIEGERGKELIRITEKDRSSEFSIRDLASEMLRNQLDDKLNDLYEEIIEETQVSSVYFTGPGFDDIWFERTLRNISEERRVFKGNNIYVKGACCYGFRKVSNQKEYPLVCRERTKARIAIDARYGSRQANIVLSEAAMSWYDASFSIDFIVNNTTWIQFNITSLLSRETKSLDFEFDDFPERPLKATRIGVELRYISDCVCEITVTDKGFGEFFESSGKSIKKRVDLGGYI